MRSVHERLQEAMDSRGSVNFDVSLPGGFDCSGFVLGLGLEWVLLHYLDDFRLDGYKLVRISDIKSMRSRHKKSQKTYNKICRQEGIADAVALPPYPVSCNSLQDALRDLKKAGKNVIVEAEHPDDDIFFIGRLTRIGSKNICGRYFDATGKWDAEDTKIPCDRVTSVKFESNYIQVFSKYTHE